MKEHEVFRNTARLIFLDTSSNLLSIISSSQKFVSTVGGIGSKLDTGIDSSGVNWTLKSGSKEEESETTT